MDVTFLNILVTKTVLLDEDGGYAVLYTIITINVFTII